MSDDNAPAPRRRSNSETEVHRRQRSKNLAVLGALLFVVALIWIIAMVRMSGGTFP